jgi:hypothetical protein
MRKGTLFVAAALTTFMLVILVGAASAYQNIQKKNELAAQPTATTAAQLVSEQLPAEAAAPVLTPEQAASLAAQVIGRTDMFSVETTDFNGASVYLVTFSSGDLVYVSPEGQILSIDKLPVTVVSAPAARKGRGGGGDGGSSQPPAQGGGEHEDDHDDHEEHDD